ncbi:MAG: tyrosine-protein phosphatase [Novosphingobium sp.]|nr:tyrosine-protein phosphatase [Novosphingobium sp.]
MSFNRVIELEGVHNFRDYGGYPVAGGGRLKRGILWRSGQHFGATDADLATIESLGLASVFDLRTSHERNAHPCRRPDNFSAEIFFPEDPGVNRHAPHVAAARSENPTKKRDAASTREGMRRNYHAIAFRPELVNIMRTFLAELAEGRGPSLVNCMAGKDRTGIAVAMVHLATGIHRDDVIEDYVLTNTAGDVEARIRAGAESIRNMGGTMDEDVLRVVMGVEPEYLETALDKIAEQHGSIEGYLEEVLGADAVLRDRLKDALSES